MNNIKPVFFYNLSDFINNTQEFDNNWLKKVSFTIADFIGQSESSEVAIIIFKDLYGQIKEHYLEYEYFFNGFLSIDNIEIQEEFLEVNKNNIQNIERYEGIMVNADISGLDEFIKEFIYNNFNNEHFDKFYLHITPSENLDSIYENGFYAGEPTGDRMNSNNEDNFNDNSREDNNSGEDDDNSGRYVDNLDNDMSLSNNGIEGIKKFRKKISKTKGKPRKPKAQSSKPKAKPRKTKGKPRKPKAKPRKTKGKPRKPKAQSSKTKAKSSKK